MIYTNVTVKVNNNGTATSNSKVVLYRGDREVEIQITLAGNPFIIQDSTFAQLIIKRPEASPVITGIAPLKDNKVILTITEQNIDELTEVGSYAYQVRLYDDDMSSRITLPPVENGLEVREPIVDEASGQIGRAMVGYSLVSRAFALEDNTTFNEYDEYNRTYWADGDFITEGKMNKIEDALEVINRKVLSSAESAYVSSEMHEDQKVGIGESLDITFEFVSPNLGKGTMKVVVDGVQKISQYIEQGPNVVTITEDFLKKGVNKVSIYVIDRAGKTSNELIFLVRYGSTEIIPDFDPYTIYQYGASVRYYFTPSALDTSMALTFYMVIDGEVKPGIECVSDVRGYYTFPNNLSIGTHICQAYIIDAEGNKSNEVEFNLIILDAYSIAIASDTRNPVIEEGSQLVLDYRVYMQYVDTFKTKVYVDNNLVSEGECGLATSYYRTSSLTVGSHTIKIEAWDMDETVSDYIVWNVTVTESTFVKIVPTTAGASFLGTAVDRSNSDADRNFFVGYDQDGNEIRAELQEFSFDNDSGWVNNELIFNGVSSATIPVTPLAENARYGFTLDIEFTSRMVGAENALVLDLWDYSKNCGIRITQEQLIIRSAEGNEVTLYFEDNANTSAMFVIDRNEKKAKIYLNGVMCGAFNLSDYEANGQMILEDFSVNSPIKLAGSGYCKIRNLRTYQVALTTNEIINNYISNKLDKDEQKELVAFQNGLHLPTLTIYCDFSGLGKDDKKPCKIVYSSTDEEKYGPSFTLDHKMSSCQYQGTSSMAYPIKNYRINLADETGAKWKYPFPYGKPEHRFTLKADFMSSGHWQNTGLTKWVNNNLYHYDENNEKSMNPKKWFDIHNGGKLEDTRECIYGFPCRLILINDGNTPLNEGQNEPAPGNTKDMGIFNFNHDKDATDTMGFDQDNFPNCMSFEVTANSDTSAGAFMSFDGIRIDYMMDPNWGRTNIHLDYIPLEDLNLAIGDNISGNTISIVSKNNLIKGVGHATYDENLVSTNVGLNGFIPDNTRYIVTTLTMNDLSDETIAALQDGDISINGRTVYLSDLVYTGLDFTKLPNKGFYTDQSDELEYLQQSFEMRFPDPDDYNEWHGYLGLNAGTMVTEYLPVDGGYSTTYWNWDWSQMALGIDSASTLKTIECYYGDEFLANISFNKTNGNARLIDGTNKIRFIFESIPEYFRINDVKYIFGNEVAALDVIDPYLGEEISPEYGLKRVIDWVDNCSDAEFVRDFEQYFHKDYTLRYYLLVMALGMVDNLGKNMMLDSWDGQIWMPRFYDCDTICSYDNTGDIVFDVDIEMEQGYWNTSSSRLWTRLRDLMHADLVTTYNDMRQNGLSFEALMDCFYGEQISKIPQKYYNQDYDVKYAPFGESYMGMAHGDGYEHLKRWLKKRLYFTDSLFDYAPSYNNDILTIRANTTEQMTLVIETYDPVYQHLSWFNGQMDKKKIDKGVAISFSGKAMAATDQEVLIYGGSNVKKISGISSANPSELILGAATRLVELDASNCQILSQINLNKANLSAHTYLTKANLENCPMLGGNLRVNNSPLIREINIKGTAIDGLMLPSAVRNLEIMRLTKTIPSLSLHNAGVFHTLEFEPGVNLASVDMSNCSRLTNVTNFELANCPSVSLNNSYNNVKELYFINTTNLTLRNMQNLEKVIYLPNDEYETFNRDKINNAPDYVINAYNCPKLSTFMTTAPYRNSYRRNSEFLGTYLPGKERTELEYLEFNGTQYFDTKYSIRTNTYIVADVDMDPDVEYNYMLGGNSLAVQIRTSTKAMHIRGCSITPKEVAVGDIPACDIYARNTYTIKSTLNDNFTLNLFAGHYNNSTTVEEHIKGHGKLYSVSIYEDAVTPKYLKHKYTPCYDAAGVACLYDSVTDEFLYTVEGDVIPGPIVTNSENFVEIWDHNYGPVAPDTAFIANNLDISNSQFTDVKLLCTTDVNTLKLPPTVQNMVVDSAYDLDTVDLVDGTYDIIHTDLADYYNFDKSEDYITTIPVSEVVPLIDGNLQSLYPSAAGGDSYTDKVYIKGDYSVYDDGGYSWFSIVGFNANDQVIWVNKASATQDKTWFKGTIPDNTDHVRFGVISGRESLTITYKKDVYGEVLLGDKVIQDYPANGQSITYLQKVPILPGTQIKITRIGGEYGYSCYIIGYGFDGTTITQNKTGAMNDFTFTASANTYYVDIELQNILESFRLEYATSLRTPDIVPSAADGSLIYSMYAPSKTSKPASGVWDMTGLTFNTYLTHGVNNDVESDITYYLNTWKGYSALIPIEWARGKSITGKGSHWVYPADENYEFYIEPNGSRNICAWNPGNMDVAIEIVENEPAFKNRPPKYVALHGLSEYVIDGITYKEGVEVEADGPWCSHEANSIKMPFKDDSFELNVKNIDISNEVFRYTSTSAGTMPYFNPEFEYDHVVTEKDGLFQHSIFARDMNNLPTSFYFANSTVSSNTQMQINAQSLLRVDKVIAKCSSSFNMSFYWCGQLEYVNVGQLIMDDVTSAQRMFYNCSKLKTIEGIEKWNVNKLRNAWEMFRGCGAITTVNINDWYKWSECTLTNVDSMFAYCSNLTRIDAPNLVGKSVTTTANMFNGCSKLEYVNTSHWDTSGVTTSRGMFSDCSSLTTVDVSDWDMSNNTNISEMFPRCSSLTELDVTNWYFPKAVTINSTFYNCGSLETLDVSGWDMTNITEMINAFNGCIKLKTLPIDKWSVPRLSNANSAFRHTGLVDVDLSGWGAPSSVALSYLFVDCPNLKSINLENWTKEHVEFITNQLDEGSIDPPEGIIYGTAIIDETVLPPGWTYSNAMEIVKFTATTSGVVPDFGSYVPAAIGETDNGDGTFTVKITTDSLDNIPTTCSFYNKNTVTRIDKIVGIPSWGTFQNCSSLEYVDVRFMTKTGIRELANVFNSCSVLKEIKGIEDWDVSGVADFRYAFNRCENLSNLDLSKWDTSSMTNFGRMFAHCHELEEIPGVENFKTRRVQSYECIFDGCYKLKSLDLSKWDTSGMMTMDSIWAYCYALETLDVTGWNTKNVSSFTNHYAYSGMFLDCRALKEIKGIEDWDLRNITSLHQTFSGCGELTSLNLSKWGISNKVTNISGIFSGCSKLANLNLSGWDTSNVTNMYAAFRYCAALTNIDFLSGLNLSNVENLLTAFANCTNLTTLDMSPFTGATNLGSFCIDCTNLKSVTGLITTHYTSGMGGNAVNTLAFGGCTNLETIESIDVTYTNLFTGNFIEADYWISVGWRLFYGLTNLKNVTFTGQVLLYDTMSEYRILGGCDTTNFTIETWRSFVSIFPETTTTKYIVVGKDQLCLNLLPDEIAEALTSKGYSLMVRN